MRSQLIPLVRARLAIPAAATSITATSRTSPSPYLPMAPAAATTRRPYSSSFQSHPAPPRLPPDQQAEFERLQRAASSAPERHGSSSQQPMATSRHVSSPDTAAAATAAPDGSRGAGGGEGEGEMARNLNDGVWRGAPPEFEGDTNPRTGEVGGPKNEPLRWGGKGDWSYNGRVTDF